MFDTSNVFGIIYAIEQIENLIDMSNQGVYEFHTQRHQLYTLTGAKALLYDGSNCLEEYPEYAVYPLISDFNDDDGYECYPYEMWDDDMTIKAHISKIGKKPEIWIESTEKDDHRVMIICDGYMELKEQALY